VTRRGGRNDLPRALALFWALAPFLAPARTPKNSGSCTAPYLGGSCRGPERFPLRYPAAALVSTGGISPPQASGGAFCGLRGQPAASVMDSQDRRQHQPLGTLQTSASFHPARCASRPEWPGQTSPRNFPAPTTTWKPGPAAATGNRQPATAPVSSRPGRSRCGGHGFPGEVRTTRFCLRRPGNARPGSRTDQRIGSSSGGHGASRRARPARRGPGNHRVNGGLPRRRPGSGWGEAELEPEPAQHLDEPQGGRAGSRDDQRGGGDG
jgi:hypothetical protein